MTDADELSCPRCGERIDRLQDAPTVERGEQVRVATKCPRCSGSLEIVMELAMAAGDVQVWVEDRRDDEN